MASSPRSSETDDELLIRGPLLPGTVVDGCYRIVRRLGAGGTGVVYLAEDLDLDRPVAIKLKLGETTQPQLERLWREAKMMARLSHPHVVSVYEVGTYQGMLFIAMEYIERGTAREWLEERRRTWAEIVSLYRQAGSGLAAAHGVGAVHRDFKPDSILVGADGSARVADFGLAQPLTSEADPHAAHPLDDQYSFCVALFEALYGAHPSETQQRKNKGGIPSRIAQALERGLSTEPADRYPDMQSLLSALDYDPSRRKTWALLAVGTVGLASAVGLASYRAADRGPTCDNGAAAILGTWNPGQRARLAVAFAASGVPTQQQTLTRTSADLDAYAQAWGEARDEACRATHVHGEQSSDLLDRRVECLDRRRDALAAAIEVLATADAGVVSRALDVTRSLPELDLCANATVLEAEVEPPPQHAAREVAAIRSMLDRSRAQRAAGQLGAAVASADQALADAEAQDYPPVVAEALVQVASAQMGLGNDDAAVEPSHRGFRLALRLGQDRLALEAAVHIPFFALELQESLRRLDTAEALAHRLGLADRYEPKIAMIRGTVYSDAGNYERAEQELKAALAGATDPLAIATSRKRLATVFRVTGRKAEARVLLEEALTALRETFGEQSWLVAGALEDLALVVDEGDIDEARRLREEAIAIHRAVAGPDAPRVLSVLGAMAADESDAGNYQRARALFEEALALSERLGSSRARGTVGTVANAAEVWSRLGDDEGAIELAERALALSLERNGSDHVETAMVRINLAGLYMEVHRDADAERELLVAAETLEALQGPSSRELLFVYLNLMQVRRTDRPNEAYEAAERAAEIADAVYQEGYNYDQALIAHSLGLLLHEDGRPREAAEQLGRCAEVTEHVYGAQHPRRTDCLYLQGQALADAGQDPLEVYEAAAASIGTGAESNPHRIAVLFAALAERVHRTDRPRSRTLAVGACKATDQLPPDDGSRTKVRARMAQIGSRCD